jgi:hypothetical protein
MGECQNKFLNTVMFSMFGIPQKCTVKTRVPLCHLLRHRNSALASVISTLKSVGLSVKTKLRLSYRVLEKTVECVFDTFEYNLIRALKSVISNTR